MRIVAVAVDCPPSEVNVIGIERADNDIVGFAVARGLRVAEAVNLIEALAEVGGFIHCRIG